MKVQSIITKKFTEGIDKKLKKENKKPLYKTLALGLGWSQSNLSKTLSKANLTLDEAYALASYFGCTIDEIIFPEKYESNGIPAILYEGITKDLQILIKDFLTIYKKMEKHKISKSETKK